MQIFPSSVPLPSPPRPSRSQPPPPPPPPPSRPVNSPSIIENRVDFGENQCRNLSDFEIVEFCRTTRPFAGNIYGNQLVRISQQLAVKFGIGVARQEAENQNHARRHVDLDVLYVPQVFRFFETSFLGARNGFILMELVQGVGLDSLNVLDDPSLASRVMEAVQHLATIPIPADQGPGPVSGGPAQGYLWSDEGTETTFRSITDMENWMNIRLSVYGLPSLSFKQQKLYMRHMDLVRRNICLLPNTLICFMDWAFAGFYPEIFEIYVFRYLKSTDELWFSQLLNLMPEPTTQDEQTIQSLGIPGFASTKYA